MINIETLNDYLLRNNIIVNNNYFKSARTTKDSNISEQIKLIYEIDKVLTAYSSIGYTRLYSVIGKKVENFKVQLRRLKVDLSYREEKEDINEVDKFILNNGESIIKRGWEVIRLLDDIDYISIINRSMSLNEICLGKTDESNLRRNATIEIGKLKSAAYNVIEEDLYIYLKKLRVRSGELEVEGYIDEFININNLNNNSKEYIKILLLFPSTTLKQWIKYKENKKNLSVDEYLTNIKNAFECES